MKVLISGAGIAGPTLAYWLGRFGFEPTLVEHASALRTGGYIVDFWGVGYDVAEKMSLLPAIHEKGYNVKEVRIVDRMGRRKAGFSAKVFERATKGRYTSLPRGELAALVYGALEGRVETIFGDSIATIEQSENAVDVTFESGTRRAFDLVIGADGLHSKVRQLVFGPYDQFEKYLGYKVAAFETGGYRPRDEDVYMMFTEVGQQVARFSMRGDETMFLFVYADDNPYIDGHDIETHKRILQNRFSDSGWECPQILEALDKSPALYFDRVSQIRMPETETGLWHRGRVGLVGDAAYCVSLLAGQGSSLAMAGAYILAGELHRAGGDYKTAFARYEEIYGGGFIREKQETAAGFGSAFAPKTRPGLFFRDQIARLMAIPLVANLAIGKDLKDNIELPDYV